MDEEKQEQASNGIGKQLKEGAKKQAKDSLKNKVFKSWSAKIKFYLLLVVMAICLIVGIYAFLMDLITHNQSKKSREASASAISYNLTNKTETDNKDEEKKSSTIEVNINSDNNAYELNYKFFDDNENERNKEEVLEEIKEQLEDEMIDISNFSESELYVIGILMEKGLQIEKYNAEELKCLVLCLKADIASNNFDLRPKDEIGKEVSEDKMYGDEIYGTLQVHKIKVIKNDEGNIVYEEIPLEYLPYEEFEQKVDDNNMEVINNFTINEDQNLLTAKWNIITESCSYYDENGNALSEEQIPAENRPNLNSRTTVSKSQPIDYKENIADYIVSYPLLSDLLIVTGNVDFCTELCKLAFNSKIVINVKEQLTETTTDTINEYTQTTKTYDYVDYKVTGTAVTESQTGNYSTIAGPVSGAPTPSSVGHGWNSSVSHRINESGSRGRVTTYTWYYNGKAYQLIDIYNGASRSWTLQQSQTVQHENPLQSSSGNNTLITDNNIYTSQEVFKYNISIHTFSQQNSYNFEISDIDCWYAIYNKEYEPPKIEDNTISSGPAKDSNVAKNTQEFRDEANINSNQYVKQFKEKMEAKFKQDNESSTQKIKNENCNVTYLKEVKNVKTDISTSVNTTTKKYKFGEEKADTTDIVLKNVEFTDDVPSFTKEDKDGNEETNSFLYVYDKYKNDGKNLFLEEDAEKELFELLEEETNTQKQSMVLKYLLYVYDGIDRGVTEFDLSLFNPKEFKGLKFLGSSALIEHLRSWEHNNLREYRNGTASADIINFLEEHKYVRKNPETGEIEYGLDELLTYGKDGSIQDHSLNYSYGLRMYDYVTGKIAADYIEYFNEEGISLQERVQDRLNGGNGWVNADLVDRIQVKTVDNIRRGIIKEYEEAGVDLDSYEADALTAMSYAYGSGFTKESNIELIRQYKEDKENQSKKQNLINNFTVTRGHPFLYPDNPIRRDHLQAMFFEGRYFLSTGEEIFAGGDGILGYAKMVHDYMSDPAHPYYYCLLGSSQHENVHRGEGLSCGLNNSFQESQKLGSYGYRLTCCATYVSWVLQEAGLIDVHHNGCPGLSDTLRDAGWIRIDSSSELEPGDVVFYRKRSGPY